MNISGFRLTSGEDIIGEFVSSNELTGQTKLKNAVIAMLQDQNGKYGLGLFPFIPFAKDGVVSINTNSVTCTFDLEQPLINEYSRLYGSGIEIVSAMPSFGKK